MGISMRVGGIGIRNMMRASVAECTREIGLLNAPGATRAWIVAGFITEAVLLSLPGCLLGPFLSALVIGVLHLLPNFPVPATPAWAVAVSVFFCMLAGGVFGGVTAVNAANMEPKDAIRQ